MGRSLEGVTWIPCHGVSGALNLPIPATLAAAAGWLHHHGDVAAGRRQIQVCLDRNADGRRRGERPQDAEGLPRVEADRRTVDGHPAGRRQALARAVNQLRPQLQPPPDPRRYDINNKGTLAVSNKRGSHIYCEIPGVVDLDDDRPWSATAHRG